MPNNQLLSTYLNMAIFQSSKIIHKNTQVIFLRKRNFPAREWQTKYFRACLLYFFFWRYFHLNLKRLEMAALRVYQAEKGRSRRKTAYQ